MSNLSSVTVQYWQLLLNRYCIRRCFEPQTKLWKKRHPPSCHPFIYPVTRLLHARLPQTHFCACGVSWRPGPWGRLCQQFKWLRTAVRKLQRWAWPAPGFFSLSLLWWFFSGKKEVLFFPIKAHMAHRPFYIDIVFNWILPNIYVVCVCACVC